MNTYPATCREALDLLDRVFVTLPEPEALKLWSVLSALRGPDGIKGHIPRHRSAYRSPLMRCKRAFTAIIRRKALPNLTLQMMIGDDDENYAAIRRDLRTPVLQIERRIYSDNGHFFAHAEKAFEALGLDVRKVNP